MSRAGVIGDAQLRIATADDVPVLFAIRTSVRENLLDRAQLAARGVTPASVSATLTRAGACTWVIEAAGEVAAFSMADAREGTVFALFVDPETSERVRDPGTRSHGD